MKADGIVKCVSLIAVLMPLLAEYEQSGKPFDQFLPTMLDHLPEYGR
jgi:hypothetical protein